MGQATYSECLTLKSIPQGQLRSTPQGREPGIKETMFPHLLSGSDIPWTLVLSSLRVDNNKYSENCSEDEKTTQNH